MYTLVSGFSVACELLCGKSSLMALGVTTVDVIIKKIKSRNTKSVIEDILKLALALFLFFNAIKLFYRFIKKVHKFHCACFHFLNHRVKHRNKEVVCKECNDTYHKTSNCGHHSGVNTI